MGGIVLMINIKLDDKYFEISKERIENYNKGKQK